MKVQHDMASRITQRHLGINSTNYAKSNEKLASGYRINRAADDAAGLNISENMRFMIRGLRRGAKNAEDGIDFICTGDSAMSEIDAMLHRMRELAVQSLNDTNTDADRLAMEAEFESMQSEIDHICRNTQFNSENVFDEHEPAFFQVEGSIQWDYNQIHEIMAPENDLVISIAPDNYTLTVPDGIYTTQELLDEIDTAFSNMHPNPGLSLEFTKDGRCNLNLEGGTQIDNVGGKLSYLIYGRYDGGAYGSLLGTTAFTNEYPLGITPENDTITFYMQSMTGGGEREVTMKLPNGSYSKDQLMKLINAELDRQGVTDIRAKEYGKDAIQLAGVDNVVTGLKGNMFKLETSGNIYTSIFYDNVKYGQVNTDPATISGSAYYYSYYTTNYEIRAGINDVLKVKLDGKPGYTDIKIAPSSGAGYTAVQLRDAVNQGIRDAGLDMKLECTVVNKYAPGSDIPFSYGDCLVLTTKERGAGKSIEIDTANTISKAAYDSLFVTTNLAYPTNISWSEPYNYISGRKSLTSPIEIGVNKDLYFSVGGTDYSVALDKDTYANAAELAQAIQDHLPAYLQDKITVSANGSYLEISDNTPAAVGRIDKPVGSGNMELFKKLFEGEDCNYVNEVKSGIIEYKQGSTEPVKISQASVVMPYTIPSDSIPITNANNTFAFRLETPDSSGYSVKSIKIPARDRPYSKSELISEMNRQFQSMGYPLEASISGGAFKLTTTYAPSGRTMNFGIEVYSGDNGFNSVLTALIGSRSVSASSHYNDIDSYIQGSRKMDGSFLIDSSNDTLSFRYDGQTVTVKVPAKNYSSGAELADALQKALDGYKDGPLDLNGTLKVTNEANGLRIQSTGHGTKFSPSSCSGTFYEKVLRGEVTKAVDGTPSNIDGKFKWDDSFVIGRQDVKNTITKIVKNLNDQFIIDFNCPDSTGKMKAIPLQVTIPEGAYDGNSLAAVLKTLLNDRLHAPDIGLADFTIDAAIGGHTTSVVGNNDANSLQFTLHYNTVNGLDHGNYYLDGVRGSSAFVLFYKTVGLPREAFVDGSIDIGKGVNIQPGKNTFTFTTDGTTYVYQIPEGNYTGEELVDKLNELIGKPDASGSVAPIRVTMENGRLRLSHNKYGRHPITDIGGTAKGTIFYKEDVRTDVDARMLQVGDKKNNDIELTRVLLNTSFMHINSVTISKPKYAEKALDRMDYALNYLNRQRAKWGALHNRLEKAVSVDGINAENTQSAESLIRDTDFGDELLKSASARILEQSAQAVLAQNSASARMVLQLLR